jgi:putative transposase
MRAVQAHGKQVGVAALCAALAVPRATFYRQRKGTPAAPQKRRQARGLSDDERAAVLAVLHEPRFADLSPGEVHATLLDEGTYLCSERTMYRILAANDQVRERRDQLAHPPRKAPELLATKPNQLWSWDITKLKGPAKWTYFHLYVILDVFSRYVVGWMVAHREAASLAQTLIQETCERQKILPAELTVHADNGSSMTSKPVAFLMADLGVTKSHSRPYVSNDNPFSEAHFKTLKYRPGFPDRFGSIEDARKFCTDFFYWYNCLHYHSGIALLRPHDVHHGFATMRLEARSLLMTRAYTAHAERFPNGPPRVGEAPKEVWINKPKTSPSTANPSQ